MSLSQLARPLSVAQRAFLNHRPTTVPSGPGSPAFLASLAFITGFTTGIDQALWFAF